LDTIFRNPTRLKITLVGYKKTPTRKIDLGGSPTLSQKMTVLWEPVPKMTNLGQSCPTCAKYRFYEGAFSAGSITLSFKQQSKRRTQLNPAVCTPAGKTPPTTHLQYLSHCPTDQTHRKSPRSYLMKSSNLCKRGMVFCGPFRYFFTGSRPLQMLYRTHL
jgi:hypothetical protein